MTSSRYLTKSRFKLATECPRKLFYTGKKAEYLDRSTDDSFLAALAEGGYQVGELACWMYPGGVRVDELDHKTALEKTEELLKQVNVTIYEAAFSIGALFVRVDILRKTGDDIELIEVKAKSYSEKKDRDFRGAKGQIKSEFRPYLLDVAFQRHVVQQAMPKTNVKAFLLLVNKEVVATVDGINQRFKVTLDNGRLRVTVAAGTSAEALGTSLLAAVGVDAQIDELLQSKLLVAPLTEKPFFEAVQIFSDGYAEDVALPPIPSAGCASCQYSTGKWPASHQLKSGFHECWSEAFGWKEDDFSGGTVLDLWNFRGKDKLIDQGILKLQQVTLEHVDLHDVDPPADGMTVQHRQWFTCSPDWPDGGEFFFDRDGYLAASSTWKYPLHCIDFETSTVAIPFLQGGRPYEVNAFQFSHHVIHEDGTVEHRSEWLDATPGKDPNLEFLRALKAALSSDDGTIFRWSAHENTVLNALRDRMAARVAPPADAAQLMAFIDSITTRGSGDKKVHGARTMVDLCKIAEKFYFHPMTKGSNSLKKVLPALMASSDHLRSIYSQPTYGGAGTKSLNFNEPIAWWQEKGGEVADPYSLLPPIFLDVSADDQAAVEEGLSEELREGGAAMAAYARLQFEDMPAETREAIKRALLRYCELDTLAMVMAIQAWSHEAHAA